jgi:His-Xaa-Ser system protein HxsD
MITTVEVQKGLYPLEVIYGTSYQFLENCYVKLEQADDGQIKIHLRAKTDELAKEMGDIEGEFQNELLNQAYRRKLSSRVSKVRDMVVQRALYSALVDQSVPDEIESDDLNFLDDPLGIAVPWEEKFDETEKNEGQDVADSAKEGE